MILTFFVKGVRQRLRDPLGLALTLGTAPCFVLLYWLFFAGATPDDLVIVQGAAGGEDTRTARFITALEDTTLDTAPEASVTVLRATRGAVVRGADAVVLLPPEFEDDPGPDTTRTLELVGDASDPGFLRTRARIGEALSSMGGAPRLYDVRISARGRSATRSAFEAYVPALLVFAVIMLVFSSSMDVAREVESGMLERLRLTRAGPHHVLLGAAGVHALLGALSAGLTMGVALTLGFESAGSIALALGITWIAGFSCIGYGVVVAALAHDVQRAFLLSSFVMFLLLLFSGAVFPMPEVSGVQVLGVEVDPLDALPTTHAVRALDAVLTLGEGAREVYMEITALVVLSAMTFTAGAAVFTRRHRTYLTGA
ncbi:MAG: ABC transporter permease [Myxococcota bacterium]